MGFTAYSPIGSFSGGSIDFEATEPQQYATIDGTSGGTENRYRQTTNPSCAPGVQPKSIASSEAARDRGPRTVTRGSQWFAIRHLVVRIEDELAQMAEITRQGATGDLMDLANSGHEVEALVHDLWGLRDSRQDGFGDLVNMLQGLLARETFEQWTTEKCRAVSQVVVEVLKAFPIGIPELNRAMVICARAGLDPWRPISGDRDD
jgi:hypothetical protein